MDRKEFYRREMIDEFKAIIGMIEHEESLERRLYYFSAAYGATQRTLRSDFTKEVLMMDLALTTAYNLLVQRFNQLKNRDTIVHPDVLQRASDEVFHHFGEVVKRLEESSDPFDPLMSILAAAYSTTGNGNYLHELGRMP
jgi:hypothetical protein